MFDEFSLFGKRVATGGQLQEQVYRGLINADSDNNSVCELNSGIFDTDGGAGSDRLLTQLLDSLLRQRLYTFPVLPLQRQ